MSAEQISLIAITITVMGWVVTFFLQRKLLKLQEQTKQENEVVGQLRQSKLRIVASLNEWFRTGLVLAEEAYTFKQHPLSNRKDQETILGNIEMKSNLWIAEAHRFGNEKTRFLPDWEEQTIKIRFKSRGNLKINKKQEPNIEKQTVVNELFGLIHEFGSDVTTYIRTSNIKDTIENPSEIRNKYERANNIIRNKLELIISVQGIDN